MGDDHGAAHAHGPPPDDKAAPAAPADADHAGPPVMPSMDNVYAAVIGKKPLAAMTPFPVPDTKEEVAEFCMFIRAWLHDVASKHLLAEQA